MVKETGKRTISTQTQQFLAPSTISYNLIFDNLLNFGNSPYKHEDIVSISRVPSLGNGSHNSVQYWVRFQCVQERLQCKDVQHRWTTLMNYLVHHERLQSYLIYFYHHTAGSYTRGLLSKESSVEARYQ